ncbi:MAG: hypothetical protein NC120_06015 [Ruminococcus sp.]|nr:hypothetical protein [Ruminococcus sp.]
MSMSPDKLVSDITEKIKELCDPYMIFLFSRKTNTAGATTSLKLCVVISDEEDPDRAEARLLLSIDSPVPCDFIVYSISDWNDCSEDDCSFAYRVENGGERLYVKE